MALTLSDIEHLFAVKGARMYSGEPVTQIEHALQCAQLAEQENAAAPLVVAALLHDLGHMLNDQGDTPTLRGIDDKHQYVALPFLRGLFDDAVLEPIRLHVDSSYAIGVVTGNFKAKANVALVEKIRDKARRFPRLRFVKVEGHAGVPENERADRLATDAIRKR